jgi:hypothetical protein
VGVASRTKGRKGEAEVAKLWLAGGYEVRNLEGVGDHLVLPGAHQLHRPGTSWTLHEEVKRQERPRVNEWWKQAVAEAPAGTIALVTFRPSYAPWLSMLATTDLIRLAG